MNGSNSISVKGVLVFCPLYFGVELHSRTLDGNTSRGVQWRWLFAVGHGSIVFAFCRCACATVRISASKGLSVMIAVLRYDLSLIAHGSTAYYTDVEAVRRAKSGEAPLAAFPRLRLADLVTPYARGFFY